VCGGDPVQDFDQLLTGAPALRAPLP